MNALDLLLLEIAKAFREREVYYAIGGSRMLQFYGIACQPRDLDLIVDIADFIKAATFMNSLGNRQSVKHDERYLTKAFARFSIRGIEVDLIADFTIRHHDYIYTYPFSDACIKKTFLHENEKIPACYLEDWYFLYQLMGDRATRVAQIAEHFRNTGTFDHQRFRDLLADRIDEFESDFDFSISKTN